MYKTTSITIYGTLRGNIWMPNAECTKEVQAVFTPDGGPFTEEWAGLRHALVRLTNDGDFRSCGLDNAVAIIERRSDRTGSIRRRTVYLRPDGENSDCFWQDKPETQSAAA
jgi:hypothetical protein